MFDLWCQLKRGIKDSTFKNYIYMYELFVKPSFGKNRLVQVKKSDVRKFYNSLADGKVLKIATIDNVHNVLHQVFQVAVDDGMIRQNPTDNMLKELMLIMMYGAQNGITVKNNSDSELGVRLVAYLPELHCAVDIAGATVTEKREQSVKAHICQRNRLGYYLIKRTTDTSQMAAEIKTLFIRNHIYLHTDSEKDVQVLRERFLEWKNRNACKLNGKY